MKRFNKSKGCRFRKERNETNDCGVLALSILGRMTYEKAHGICEFQGRKHRMGMWTTSLLCAFEQAGFKATEVKQRTSTKNMFGRLRQPNGSKYTPKTIGKRLHTGYYLCVTDGHFFSVVNGDVEDWSKDRRLRVIRAYKIVRTR